jgi:hypothetical protein
MSFPSVDIKVTFFDGQSITTTIVSQPLSERLKNHFISGHVSPNVLYHGDISGAVHQWCGYCKTVIRN